MTNFVSRPVCILLCTLIAVMAQSAFACTIIREEPEKLKRQAEVVVLVCNIESEAPRQTFRSVVYPYKVSIESVERGSLSPGISKFTYEDLRAHRRGDLTVCPIIHGSGIERELQSNTSYRMYLRSATNKEILFAEKIPTICRKP